MDFDARPDLTQVELRTPRLLLRAPRISDAPALAEQANDPRVAAGTLALPSPYLLHDAETFISLALEARAKRTFMANAVIREADEQFLGMMGLVFTWDHRRAELGYWLGVPFWNQGYATEAAAALTAYAFRELDMNRVYATHFSDNPASGRVMQKLGMQYEGVLRHHYWRFDQPHDAVCYGLLRPEWEARTAS